MVEEILNYLRSRSSASFHSGTAHRLRLRRITQAAPELGLVSRRQRNQRAGSGNLIETFSLADNCTLCSGKAGTEPRLIAMSSLLPIAVDLDGTLSKSDCLEEALARAVLRSPASIPGLTRAFLAGRLDLKLTLHELGAYKAETVPLRDDLISYLHEQREMGRSLHLVTASPQPIADTVSKRVGVFDTATGSNGTTNLKGDRKAEYLRERFPEGFCYAGNDQSDLQVWRHAKSAITVATPTNVERELAKLGVPVERSFRREAANWRELARMLRLHQWAKNILLFVPLFLSHRYFNPDDWINVFIGFVAMGCIASATYILNDVSDLDADRRHPTKSKRPLASAQISVRQGIATGIALSIFGFGLAALLNLWFAAWLAAYVILTVSYSTRLKAVAILDIFILGLLYTIRIVMGTVLIGVSASPWLLVFSLFFFFALSAAKRHVEIVRADQRGVKGRIPGRGYFVSDEPLTLALGIAANCVAVMLLFLYVANDAYPQNAYSKPDWLWIISPLVFLWSTRIWLKSHRGRLDDDPVSFAFKDPPSLLIGALIGGCFLMALV